MTIETNLIACVAIPGAKPEAIFFASALTLDTPECPSLKDRRERESWVNPSISAVKNSATMRTVQRAQATPALTDGDGNGRLLYRTGTVTDGNGTVTYETAGTYQIAILQI
jgi:hypothetical protein